MFNVFNYFRFTFYCFLFCTTLINAKSALADNPKKNIELIHANVGEFEKRISAKKLIGDVVLKDNHILLYCDSAYIFENNVVDIFGHVHINQTDTLNAYSDFAHYDGISKIAYMFKNVTITNKEMTLQTDTLNINFNTNIADYNHFATIKNDSNTLTSIVGQYFINLKKIHFTKNVILQTPKYQLNSDELIYFTNTGFSNINSTFSIIGKLDSVYAKKGKFQTKQNIFHISDQAYLRTGLQTLNADSIYYNQQLEILKGFNKVILNDHAKKVRLTGDYLISDNKIKVSRIIGNALLTKINNLDSLYIQADTICSQKDSLDRLFTAFHHVLIFKPDLQGKCDSMSFSLSDSILKMYIKPIVWSNNNQLTAKEIKLQISAGFIKSIELLKEAFIISKVDSAMFNQIKGKKMFGTFFNNELVKITVDGNGQTIYFAKEKDKIIGINKAECSNLIVFLKNQQIDKVSFINKPEAILIPLNEYVPKEMKLKDFSWQFLTKPNGMKNYKIY